MHVKKKLISLLLALGMLGGTQTALAAEPAAQEAAPLPAWSYGMLADGYCPGAVWRRDLHPAQPDRDHGAAGYHDQGGGRQAGPAGGGDPARR